MNDKDQGVITDRADAQAIEALLGKHATPLPEKHQQGASTTLRARGQILIAPLELRHE